MAQRVNGRLGGAIYAYDAIRFRASNPRFTRQRRDQAAKGINRALLLAYLDERPELIASVVTRKLAPVIQHPVFVEVRFDFHSGEGKHHLHVGIVHADQQSSVSKLSKRWIEGRAEGIAVDQAMTPVPYHAEIVEAILSSLGPQFISKTTDFYASGGKHEPLRRSLYFQVIPDLAKVAMPVVHVEHSSPAVVIRPASSVTQVVSMDHALNLLSSKVREIVQQRLSGHPFVEADVFMEVGVNLRRMGSGNLNLFPSVRVISAKSHPIAPESLNRFLDYQFHVEPENRGNRQPSHWVSEEAKRDMKDGIREEVIRQANQFRLLHHAQQHGELHRFIYFHLQKSPRPQGAEIKKSKVNEPIPANIVAIPVPGKIQTRQDSAAQKEHARWLETIESYRPRLIPLVQKAFAQHPFRPQVAIVEVGIHCDPTCTNPDSRLSIDVYGGDEAKLDDAKLQVWLELKQVRSSGKHSAEQSHWISPKIKRKRKSPLRAAILLDLESIFNTRVPESFFFGRYLYLKFIQGKT